MTQKSSQLTRPVQAALDAARRAEWEARQIARKAKRESQKLRENFPAHRERGKVELDFSKEP